MKLRCSVILVVLGVLMFAFGLILYFIIPVVVKNKVNDMLPLKNGSLIYQQWQNTTIPAYIQFWFFDIINPAEILNGEKPAVNQIGPYTYLEKRVKHSVSFNENTSISYLQNRTFFFDRALSVGDENDTFTTVNIPLIVIGDKLKPLPSLIKEAATVFIKRLEKYGVFMKTSVRNITWGYEDTFLKDIVKFFERFGVKLDIQYTIGLFYGKNDTDDDIYTIDSGSINLDNYLKIEQWNGSNRLTIWNDQYANMINGTDGSMFSPFLNKSSRLYVYQSDICRSIYTTYLSSSVIKGVPSLDYAAPDILFANHTVNPDNKGFCVDGYCMGAGVLNLTKCIPTAPIVMSQPHLYGAAQQYIDSLRGLHPSSDFKTLLKLEPTTGLPLELQKKLQINLAVDSVADFMGMDKLPKVLMPMMWLNESALISDDLAATLRNTLVLPVEIGKWLSVALMISGLLLVVITVGWNLKFHCSPRSKYQIINEDPV